MSWKPSHGRRELADWVASSAKLPLAFAQVREDAWIDEQLLARLASPADVLMIASGGCTAAHLAALPTVGHLHLVDVNSAQLALARLKLWMLEHTSRAERLALLGHTPLERDERRERLSAILASFELPLEIFGPVEYVAEFGPDQVGRYEWVFARLRLELLNVEDELLATLRLRDTDEQMRRTAADSPLGQRLDDALDQAMDLDSLVALFGTKATANRVQPFARHFAARIRHALATLPAADNPYLWQMLTGRFPKDACYPWFGQPAPWKMPRLTYTHDAMESTLQTLEPAQYNLVHLSNILDWLSPDSAAEVLHHAARVLRPGGLVVIRQLNSQLAIRAVPSRFRWEEELSNRLHAVDRSFFYRDLHIGRLP